MIIFQNLAFHLKINVSHRENVRVLLTLGGSLLFDPANIEPWIYMAISFFVIV